MKRGFVYAPGPDRPPPARPQPSFGVSPRKRKRSPEPGVGPEPHSQQQLRGPKTLKTWADSGPGGDLPDESDDESALDELGAAALEEYELTQQARSPSPDPVPHADLPPHSTVPNPGSNLQRTWANPYQTQLDMPHSRPPDPNGRSHPPSGRVSPQKTVSTTDNLVGQLQQENSELKELGYTKDGEVTVLRGEKERLVGELRRREEQMQEIHSQLTADRKALEEQLSREKASLTTELRFKEQELVALQQRCAMLEQRQRLDGATPPTPRQTKTLTSGKGKTPPSGPRAGGRERTEFLSTENFMPLSQMAGRDITTVAVGQKKDTQESIVNGNLSPLPVGTAAQTLPGKPQEMSVPPPPPPRSPPEKDQPIILDVPSAELNGTELLMLLVQGDLLRIPSFNPEGAGEGGEEEEKEEDVVTVETSSNLTSPCDIPSLVDKRLPGLLSLLHLPSHSSLPHTPCRALPSILTTPVSATRPEPTVSGSSFNTSGGSLRPMPSLDSSVETTPKTPVSRRPRLLPFKFHTCARSDISRARSRLVAAAHDRRSLSAVTTPVHHNPEYPLTSSLAGSINTGGLKDGIASLLRSTDTNKLSAMLRRPKVASLTGVWSPPRGTRDSSLLLPHIGDIIIRYYTEQLSKAKASYASGLADHMSDLGEGMEPSNVLLSPKQSLSTSSTTSSRFSQDFTPLLADQELVSQALEILETLSRYSRRVREALLAKPLEFDIDSRPSSAIGSNSTRNEEGLAQEGLAETPQHIPGWKRQREWEGRELATFGQTGTLSGKVWAPAVQDGSRLVQSESVASMQATPICQAVRGGGQLFSTLLNLTAPPWRESTENALKCVRILTTVAEDCSVEELEMFRPLLLEDLLDWCLEREDCNLTLSILSLLTHVSRSPKLVSLLCRQEDSCILLSCYSCFLDPPSGPAYLIHRIHMQLLRFISAVLNVSNGPQVLFECPSCACSHELLRSVVGLLNHLLEDVFQPDQLSPQRLVLVCELVSLVHRVSAQNRDYDTHREACHHQLTSVLNRLSWLFRGIPSASSQLGLLHELLESCEEDSQESSERMDEG